MKIPLFTLLIFSMWFSPIIPQNKNINYPQEKVFLHTDRNILVAGDNLFYALYLKGNDGMISKYAYMILRDRNNQAVTQIRVDIRNQMAYGRIYLPDTLSTNVYQLVCYTNFMRNGGEDSFFTKEIVVINRFDKKLEYSDSTLTTNTSRNLPEQHSGMQTGDGKLIINLEKDSYYAREKIKFSIGTNLLPGDTLARVSVSIREVSPSFSDELSFKDYYNKVINHSFVSEPDKDINRFHRELNYSVIEGRVIPVPDPANNGNDIKKDTNKYTILVSAPDTIANMQFTTTDSSGAFCIFLNNYYEGKEVFIRTREDAKAEIVIEDKFKLKKPFVISELFDIPGLKSYHIRLKNISEVQKYYNQKPESITLMPVVHSVSIPRIYYKPYSIVFPSDYLPLADFSEISKELLPASKVRKSNDHYTLSFIDLKNTSLPNLEPVIFLDGVPINDADQIIGLGTTEIKRIEILPTYRYYGEMSLTGILAVFSKNLEINNIGFKTPTIRYKAVSSQNYSKPVSNILPFADSHLPYLRQLLLWEPEIILRNKEKHEVECYASDLPGKYLINIQGITSKGNPVDGFGVITVKSK
jgi:hypothetical protein